MGFVPLDYDGGRALPLTLHLDRQRRAKQASDAERMAEHYRRYDRGECTVREANECSCCRGVVGNISHLR
jgi:hypothetical protein